MTERRKRRVMWLINHGAARKFEVSMLKRIGIDEIFLPKLYPNDPGFRSASVDFSEDQYLTIPPGDLEVLNRTNWYGSPGPEAWEIANRHFDVLFFIVHDAQIAVSCAKSFRGAILWRVYGLDKSLSYSTVMDMETQNRGEALLRKLGKRFWFAQAYPHLALVERDFLSDRSLDLPLGMLSTETSDAWTGVNKRIFFVCPDIGFSPYYEAIYKKFVADFRGLPYAIGGAQPLAVRDPNVLGFVTSEQHERNMREMRVMFYHSDEPNHIHYHPFEAIRAGMPLVYMANGLLDRLGGAQLPGRCTTVKEARRKIERILNGDSVLIDAIRTSQLRILDPMKFETSVPIWGASFDRVFRDLDNARTASVSMATPPRRIAVIVPVAYRGGSLRGAQLLAEAIDMGARQAGQPVEVVFAHLGEVGSYSDDAIFSLPPTIKRRPFQWSTLARDEAYRAMAFAGQERPLNFASYQVPDDGIQQFSDCDLWVIVSDRLELPLLPIRPQVLVVYDYLQRYERIMTEAANQWCIHAARQAERVIVTTEFTRRDAMQFAGLDGRRVTKLPMLAPSLPAPPDLTRGERETRYFIWTTNAAPHKNHAAAFKALALYYEEYAGELECHVTGVNTARMLGSKLAHLKDLRAIVDASAQLRCKLKILGELPEAAYRTELAHADFLWHAGRIDNGTFSVVEAAQFNVPALSGDYPAMHEIDEQFGLNLSWMDPHSPRDMARRLKDMELNVAHRKAGLPSQARLATQSTECLAGQYWEAIRECL